MSNVYVDVPIELMFVTQKIDMPSYTYFSHDYNTWIWPSMSSPNTTNLEIIFLPCTKNIMLLGALVEDDVALSTNEAMSQSKNHK